MTEERHKTVILVLSHVLNQETTAFFEELRQDCGLAYEVIFLADNTRGVFEAFKDDPRFGLFTLDALESLGYPGKSAMVRGPGGEASDPDHPDFNFVPGSTDLPILYWFKLNPGYDYYWVIEYDVRYSGSWRRFFSGFESSNADLLGTTLTRYRDVPDWYYWPSLKLNDKTAEPDALIRGFFPVYRLSHQALACLDREYSKGDGGHYECLVPTVLYREGLRLEDIGGDGEFVRPENRNRYYRNTPAAPSLYPGTFIYRPIMFRAGQRPNTLWHPVKSKTSGGVTLREAMEQWGIAELPGLTSRGRRG